MSRLVVRFGPEPDEGLLGWTLRLAEANGHPTPALILDAIGIGTPDVVGREDIVRNLAAITDAPTDLVDRVVPGLGHGGRVHRVGIPDMSLPLVVVEATHPKVCPRCLEDRRVARYAWDLRLWTCCPVHSCRMVSACPSCAKPLAWRRRGVDACVDPDCDGLPSRAGIEEASVAEIHVARMLDEALGGSPASGPSSMPDVFRALPPRDRVLMIARLGLKRGGGGPEAAGEGAEHDPARKVTSILADWPNGLHRFLAAQEVGRKSSQGLFTSYPGIRLLFGVTGNSGFVMPEAARAIFLREFLAYLDGRDTELPMSMRSSPAGLERRWVSLSEAARTLGIVPQTLKRIIASGEIDGRRFEAGKRQLGFVERPDLLRIAGERLQRSEHARLRGSRELMTQVEAGAFLGITPASVRSLIDHGLLDTARSGVRTHVVRSSALAMLDRLRELVLQRPASGEATATYDACEVVQHLRGVQLGGFLRSVLDGAPRPVCTRDGVSGLRAFGFARTDAAAYLDQDRRATGNMPVAAALALLRCKRSMLRDLVGKGLVSPGRTKTDIDANSVHRFLEDHASAWMLASERGTKAHKLVARLVAAGLTPVSVSRGSSAKTSYWRRSEAEGVLGLPTFPGAIGDRSS